MAPLGETVTAIIDWTAQPPLVDCAQLSLSGTVGLCSNLHGAQRCPDWLGTSPSDARKKG